MSAIVSLAVAAALQAGMIAQSSSPAPVVVTPIRAPIDATGVIPAYPEGATAVAAMPVRVRVTAGGEQLLNDVFRINRNASASYQVSRSEAPESSCQPASYSGSQERYSLNLNLYLRGETTDPMVNVSVSWQRPTKPLDCVGDGSRQVQLTQTVRLPPGQSVTIQGDAGLSVTLSR
jgi:hypothetical protein